MSNNWKKGEKLFNEQMQARGYTTEDVSANPLYWDKDIDFLVTSPFTNAVKGFEVKWDNRINSTGNLYLEIENIHSKGGKGWYNFCQADYIAYGDAVNEVFYIIALQDLKARVNELPQRLAQCGYDSIGLLVSLNDISDIVKVL